MVRGRLQTRGSRRVGTVKLAGLDTCSSRTSTVVVVVVVVVSSSSRGSRSGSSGSNSSSNSYGSRLHNEHPSRCWTLGTHQAATPDCRHLMDKNLAACNILSLVESGPTYLQDTGLS